jgi:hypothetical protein
MTLPIVSSSPSTSTEASGPFAVSQQPTVTSPVNTTVNPSTPTTQQPTTGTTEQTQPTGGLEGVLNDVTSGLTNTVDNLLN